MGMENRVEKARQLKSAGNTAFENADWPSAIAFYTQAITILDDGDENGGDMAIMLKNRAAAYLKTMEFVAAERDCDRCLQIAPMDPKALFRRCQALEGQQRFEEAYRDARLLLSVDAQNRSVQPLLTRLFAVTQERAKLNAQATHKVDSMMKLCFDPKADNDKREQAFNNLLVLAREHASSDLVLKSGVITSIQRLLKTERKNEIRVSCIRIMSALCKDNKQRCGQLLDDVGAEWFIETFLDTSNEEQVNATQHCIQTVLNGLSEAKSSEDGVHQKKPSEDGVHQEPQVEKLLTCLTSAITNRLISGRGRDAIIELLMRNCHHDQLAWAERFIEIGGLERLLEVSSELTEFADESAMRMTSSTRTVTAACISRMYENMYYDAARARFMEHVDTFLKALLLAPDSRSKVRAVVAITALLRGALDVGNSVVGKDGLLEMVLVMASTNEDALQQRVAVECIVAATSKADKARAVIAQGVDILKNLYATTSTGDAVRVRALVGLCKLASSGGLDASIKPFSEGSNCKLSIACRRFLMGDSPDEQETRRWAAEGLSYLTLDAEVKEQLVEDTPAMMALIELAKSGDQSALYGVVTTLANLCNAYEQPEKMPAELVELARFAKHHVPETHKFDASDFVSKRLHALADLGVTTALVAMAKTQSANAREMIARVFNALCGVQQLRGVVVAQGGAKALLPLGEPSTTTPTGWRHAAQALARIGITMDPTVAFPGQRVLEVIRPLVALLADDCSALENFEALMALCNLAQINEEMRRRILKEGGFAKIEHYMYEDHVMLCRAATQAMCNMAMSEDVVHIFEGRNDKMKFVVALILDDDVDTSMAAAGTAAILTSSSRICCEKLMTSATWPEAVKYMLSHSDAGIQHRGVAILRNVLQASKELAEQVIATDVLEVMMAVTKMADAERTDVVHVAEECLQLAEGYGIIRKPDNDDAN